MSKTLYIERVPGGINILKAPNGSYFCCCDIEEPTCCMYPADKLGIDYTTADLPDNLSLNWSDTDVVTVDKVGSGYAGGTVSILIENEKWVLRNTATGNARTIGRCLIREDDLVADQFEDEYVVTGETPENSFPASTRGSLCEWQFAESTPVERDEEGEYISGGDGREASVYFNDETQKWECGWALYDPFGNGFYFAGTKSGNQDSPVGDYPGTVFNSFGADYSETATVS
jgi:hypothetical protein